MIKKGKPDNDQLRMLMLVMSFSLTFGVFSIILTCFHIKYYPTSTLKRVDYNKMITSLQTLPDENLEERDMGDRRDRSAMYLQEPEFGDTGNDQQQIEFYKGIRRINRSSSMGSDRLISKHVESMSLSQGADTLNANTSRRTGARNISHFTPITRIYENHKLSEDSQESSNINHKENVDSKNLPKDPLFDNFCNERNSFGNSQPISLETRNELTQISPQKSLHNSFISHNLNPYQHQS